MKKQNKKNSINLIYIFLGLLLIVAIFNIAILKVTKNSLNERINLEIEKAKPAQLTLTIIDVNKENCPKCFDITKIVKLVSDSQKTNISKFINKKIDDKDILDKIKKLGITKFPALIIEGNINQSKFLLNNIEKITTKYDENTYFFTAIEAPYLDINSQIIGKVNLIGLYNKNCTDCPKIDLLIDGIKSSSIYLNKIEKIEINSNLGKQLVEKYKIIKVPTIIFSNELKDYKSISSNWENGVGSKENDGSYILRTINPIYYDINLSREVGNINLTIIENKNCKNCFNGSLIYPQILSKLSILNYNLNLLDSDSIVAQKLIAKYNLEKFPTMIISGDTKEYPNLKQVWDQVGIIDNNNYIFKNVELLQTTYYDINLGEIIPKLN